MSGRCYLERCDDPGCQVCTVDERLGLTQPPRTRDVLTKRQASSRRPDVRDGEAKMAGERKRAGTASKGRRGAAYVPPSRQVLGL